MGFTYSTEYEILEVEKYNDYRSKSYSKRSYYYDFEEIHRKILNYIKKKEDDDE